MFLIRPASRASTVLARMLFAGVVLQAPLSGAQVTTNITSSGLGTTVTQNGTARDITGGTRPGNGTNLFHSFGLFNIGEGGSANFLNNSGLPTSNILGRVTGGQISNIFGTIKTSNFGAANLFLINPAGWIFGPTASLNVGGSFHVSTADYVRLNDGVRFNATSWAADALLTSAPPAAFGFLNLNGTPPAIITVNGSSLQVPESQTLSVVGGDVQITADVDTGVPAALSAPSGRIQIGSFVSQGEATVDGLSGAFSSLGRVEISGGSSISAAGTVDVSSDGNPLLTNGGTVQIRGDQVDISGGAILSTSGAQSLDPDGNPLAGSAGGTVVIRGGRLFVEGSFMVADTFGDVSGAPVGIDIQMSDRVELTGGASIGTATSAKGRGGDVQITASQVSVDGSFVSTSTSVDGRAGDISVENVGKLSLTGFAEINSLNLSFGSGSAGNVTVTASELIDISGGSKLSNTTFFNGNGGQLKITAPSLRLSGEGTGVVTSTTDVVGGGIPGNVAIDVGELKIADGAQLASFGSTLEQGGNLAVHAGSALISGTDAGGFASGIYSSNSGGGAAGDISLNVAKLSLTGKAVIESGNATDPQGGNVTISANESIVISDGSGVTLRAFSQDVGQLAISAPTGSLTIDNGFVSTSTTEAGRAGDISVNVQELALTHGGQITSSSAAFASGGGGNVTINADSVSISGSSSSGVPSSPFSTDPRSGVFSTTAGTGPGGTIAVSALIMTMNDSGTISAATSGSGSAGNISLNVSNLTQSSGARIDSSTISEGQGGNLTLTATESASFFSLGSGLFSTASATGAAGQITLSTPTLTMADGGAISVATEGSGAAGNISLNVNNLNLTAGAQVVSSTTGDGAGGTLAVTAGELVSISGAGSGLFSTASSTGNAGQITVSAPALAPVPTLTMADGGKISVETSGAGSAGSILLNANTLSLTGGAQVVSSTSGAGQGGSVTATATESIFISGSGTLSSGLFSTASSTGNAGQITVFTPTLTMAESGTISVATEGSGSAGNISLNVSNFTQTGGAQVVSSTTGAGGGGNLNLTATESASFFGLGSGLFSTASATGAAGQITLSTPTLTMADGGAISVATEGSGAAGNISLNVNNLNLAGGSQVLSSTTGDGAGGTVAVTAGESISISDAGSGLFSTASSTGNAGEITLTAPALAPVPTLTMADGGTISVATSGAGSAGSILLNANAVSLTDGAQVVSSTSGAGQGGSVTATATESMSISGSGRMPSGLFSTASSTGNAGVVNVSTPTLTMSIGGMISVATSGEGNAGNALLNVSNLTQTGGAQLASSTTGAGAGGNLTITASESASFSGLGSGLFSTASSTGAAGLIALSTPTLTMADGGAISVATEGVGAAGNISLSVNNLNLAGGSQVLSSTTGDGPGGTVAVTAGGLVSIAGSGSGLFSTASSMGNAGQITASTPTLTIVDGGAISVATSGAGNAGNALLNVSNLSLSGGAQIVSSTSGAGQGGSISAKATDSVSISGPGTGLFSTASGTGPGGTINIQTAQFQITDAGVVSANSTGSVSATAGNINLVFGDTLRMENSSITTEALVADGGNISITSAASLLHMTNSQVTTSVQSGLGQGGNISIGSGLHPLDFILLNNSGIHANAFGGSGGNINIFADTFLSSLPITTAVTASSNLSTSGTIDIQASIVDVSGEISQLPEAPLQATELLRATCAARLAAGKSSSLVLGGRGGLPLEPGGLLPSPLYVAGASAISSGSRLLSGGQTASASVLGSGNEQGQLRTGWNQFQLAKIALGLGCSQ